MENKDYRDIYNKFIDEFSYTRDLNSNVFSIYDFTDFIQENLDDLNREAFIRFFIDEIAQREDLAFRGNIHDISVFKDEDTDEFLGNLVHFYHGDNFCESFYAIVYFDEHPNFFEKTDSIEANSLVELEGKLRLKTEYMEDFYYLEIHDLKYINLDGENILS